MIVGGNFIDNSRRRYIGRKVTCDRCKLGGEVLALNIS